MAIPGGGTSEKPISSIISGIAILTMFEWRSPGENLRQKRPLLFASLIKGFVFNAAYESKLSTHH